MNQKNTTVNFQRLFSLTITAILLGTGISISNYLYSEEIGNYTVEEQTQQTQSSKKHNQLPHLLQDSSNTKDFYLHLGK